MFNYKAGHTVKGVVLLVGLCIFGCTSTKSIKEILPVYANESINLNITIDTISFKREYTLGNLFGNSIKPHTRIQIRQVEDLTYQSKTIGEIISYDDDNTYIQSGRERLMFSSNVCEANSSNLCAPNFIIKDKELYTISLSKDCKKYTIKNIPTFKVTNTYVGKKKYVPTQTAFSASPSIAQIGQTLFYPVAAYGVKFKKGKSQYEIGSYDLDNNKFKIIPIPIPDFYETHHFGMHNSFDLLKSTSNDLIVAYTLRPLGYVFNIEKDEIINTFSFKSQYDSLELVTPGQEVSMKKSMYYDGFYRNFTYNKHKNHYYCLYAIGQPEDRPDGLKNTYEDRNSSFIVLNEDLEIINETLMIGIMNTLRIFPTKEGAFFIAPLSEDALLKQPNHALKVNITYD